MDRDKESVKKFLRRRIQFNAEQDFTGAFPSEEDVVKRLTEKGELKFYFGIDPTAPSLHLGHTIPLLLLKNIASLGHKVVVLIGTFTARIGDPTDKEAVRKQLSESEVNENKKLYKNQIRRIFEDYGGSCHEPDYVENDKWLAKMTFEKVIDLASSVTVQQMLTRDMFRERLSKEKPIYVHEFLYPLMQGYDSLHMKVDGEIGGNDQTFNMLVGRELAQKEGIDKIVLATRLLIDSESGRKMSKTEGGLITMNDDPQEIRRKVLALDDKVVPVVFELCTEVSEEEIQEIKNSKGDPREHKERLAEELVYMYHGRDAVDETKGSKIFPGGSGREVLDVMKAAGLADSISAAKRLVDQGAVSVNNETVEEWGYVLKEGDILRVGPGKFRKIGK
jgi:tyrosyl-tRNA synthetase